MTAPSCAARTRENRTRERHSETAVSLLARTIVTGGDL